jgi:preprotein translocase subunit YajC
MRFVFALLLIFSSLSVWADTPDPSAIPTLPSLAADPSTQAVAAAEIGGFVIPQGAFMIGLLILFYFMLVRPQMKRTKAHQKLVENLAVGDIIVSSGGLRARITRLDEDAWLGVEITEGVVVSLQRQAVIEKIKG